MKKELTIKIPNKEIKITDTVTLEKATSYLSELNTQLDSIVADREKITKPLNASLKEVRAKYKPFETQLEQAIQTVRDEMSRYATQLSKDKQEQEAKIAKRMEAGTLGVEKAIAKLEAIEQVPTTTTTEAGTLQFRPTQKLKITDIALIPRHYMLPDEGLILQELKDGVPIPGAEIEIIQIPINRR